MLLVESVTSNRKSNSRQLTHIYLKNNRAKFHPDLIWNDGALGFWKRVTDKKNNNNNKVSSNIRSVPDLKIENKAGW